MDRPGAGNGRRETRMLVATLALSVGMLLLLARFRFPDEPGRQTPAPAPLDRLAARATFDELAGIMADLERRISPAIDALPIQGGDSAEYLTAIRLTPDRAIALLPMGRTLGASGGGPAIEILARDAARDLVVVRVASRPNGVVSPVPDAKPGPRYIAAVEAGREGLTVRPVYVGRTDLFVDPRWAGSVLSIAAREGALPRGAAVFSLDGGFIGLAADADRSRTVVPAAALRALVAAAPATQASPGELTLEVQPLTPDLVDASGADRGVMVSHVAAGTTDRAGITRGDVIQSVGDTAIATVAEFTAAVQGRKAGESVKLAVIRRGKPLTFSLTLHDIGASAAAKDDTGFGAVLRSVIGVGSEVIAVSEHSAAARSGLLRGDFIVGLDDIEAPSPAEVTRAYLAADAGHSLLLAIRRGDEPRMLAVKKR